MVAPNLYDQKNRPVGLGPLLGKGGEGSVFEVRTTPAQVAKLYHKPPPPAVGEKLRAMVVLAGNDLWNVSAWPVATLHASPGGPVVGLLMPRVTGKEVHTLYSPAHRRATFPHATWEFLVHTAMNCATAFDTLHRKGVVMGDVNQSNVFVSADALVRLIDCDSFQVQAGPRVFPCDVGVPIFTPPELQGRSFRGLVRTPNHDRFGLAVLIFHLLFMGRHPFAGRYLGRGDMPLEQAIREYRFAYGPNASANQMAPPLHSLPLEAVPPAIGKLFEKAFGRSSSQPGARPSAEEWASALKALRTQLKRCPADRGHLFPNFLTSCPWCDLMRQGAPNLFIAVALVTPGPAPTGPTFVLAAVWAQIEQVPRPNTTYARPAVRRPPVPRTLPPGIPARVPPKVKVPRDTIQQVVGYTAVGLAVLLLPSLLVIYLAIFTALAVLIFGAWWGVLEMIRRGQEDERNRQRQAVLAALRREADHREEAYDRARDGLAVAEQRWKDAARHFDAEFGSKFNELRSLRDRHANLQHEYDADRRRLLRDAQAMQRAAYLQQTFISDADIPDIGPTRKAVLASYGIETAWDVEEDKVLAVPGFGPKLTRRLLHWRAQVEAGFRFNPSLGVPPAEQQALDIKYRQIRQHIEMRLLNGPGELRAISTRANQDLSQRYATVREWVELLAEAKADLEVLP